MLRLHSLCEHNISQSSVASLLAKLPRYLKESTTIRNQVPIDSVGCFPIQLHDFRFIFINHTSEIIISPIVALYSEVHLLCRYTLHNYRHTEDNQAQKIEYHWDDCSINFLQLWSIYSFHKC